MELSPYASFPFLLHAPPGKALQSPYVFLKEPGAVAFGFMCTWQHEVEVAQEA